MKKLLYITAGIIHPSLQAQLLLKKIISSINGIVIDHSRGIKSLIKLHDSEYSGIILYLHRQNINVENLAILNQFILDGGTLFAIHSASASFKNSDQFFSIIGGRFKSHGPVENFEIKAVSANPPFGSIKSFYVKDELYIHDLKNDIEPIMITTKDDVDEPVLWHRKHGSGNVYYFEPGHWSSTFIIPEIRTIIQDIIKLF